MELSLFEVEKGIPAHTPEWRRGISEAVELGEMGFDLDIKNLNSTNLFSNRNLFLN